jgi:hypothetical protein
MKHQLLVLISVGIIIFFTLLNVDFPQQSNALTGAYTLDTNDEDNTYAVALHHVISDFFETSQLVFPTGSCGDIAKELFDEIAYTPIEQSTGFSTNKNERIATISFGLDRTIGILDMMKSDTILQEADSMISMGAERVVRIPPDPMRITFFTMDLYGYSRGLFIINRGRLSTPSLNCTFVSRDGKAICDCRTHTVQDIKDK